MGIRLHRSRALWMESQPTPEVWTHKRWAGLEADRVPLPQSMKNIYRPSWVEASVTPRRFLSGHPQRSASRGRVHGVFREVVLGR